MLNVLKILFQEKNLSKAKLYMNEIWNKIEAGKVNIKDFVIAKELKTKYIVPPQ